MYNNILVPIATDHDPNTDQAIEIARRLSAEGARITALTVVESIPDYIGTHLPHGHLELARQEMQTDLEASLGHAADVKVVVVSGHSGRTILDWADENDVDCIVMASHRPDLSDYFLGSTASRVVRHAQCAVHVLR